MAKVIDSTNLGYLLGKIKAAFWRKSETSELTIDNTPTANSDNLVKSGGVYSAVNGKLSKDGGVMNDGADITMSDTTYYGSGSYSSLVVDLQQTDDEFEIKLDVQEPYIKVDGGGAFTEYKPEYITFSPDGTTVYNQSFPSKQGTFAMTSDIPTIHSGTSDPASNLGSNGDIYIKLSS